MPFLDTSIHDPAASRLAAGLKRKKPSVKDMSQHVSVSRASKLGLFCTWGPWGLHAARSLSFCLLVFGI